MSRLLFDPVIFENLKVSMENQLYDLDNLDERITIIGRQDMLDLAVMSRMWSLSFTFPRLMSDPLIKAEVKLCSNIEDLSDEILQREGAVPACTLLLEFSCRVAEPAITCPQIERELVQIWQREMQLKQRLTASYGTPAVSSEDIKQWIPLYYENIITLPFSRRINEEQMEDIESLLEHAIMTLEALERLCYSSS